MLPVGEPTVFVCTDETLENASRLREIAAVGSCVGATRGFILRNAHLQSVYTGGQARKATVPLPANGFAERRARSCSCLALYPLRERSSELSGAIHFVQLNRTFRDATDTGETDHRLNLLRREADYQLNEASLVDQAVVSRLTEFLLRLLRRHACASRRQLADGECLGHSVGCKRSAATAKGSRWCNRKPVAAKTEQGP